VPPTKGRRLPRHEVGSSTAEMKVLVIGGLHTIHSESLPHSNSVIMSVNANEVSNTAGAGSQRLWLLYLGGRHREDFGRDLYPLCGKMKACSSDAYFVSMADLPMS
jgi:hypothetical protein